MDVCAFVGVAPRGPARVPYTDEEWLEAGSTRPLAARCATSRVDPTRPRRVGRGAGGGWDEYTRLFGGFEGPGRLPYAVAAFFEQGGRRAYIVRIVHDVPDATRRPAPRSAAAGLAAAGAPAPASGSAPATRAAGATALRAALSFATRPLALERAGGRRASTSPPAAAPPARDAAAAPAARRRARAAASSPASTTCRVATGARDSARVRLEPPPARRRQARRDRRGRR